MASKATGHSSAVRVSYDEVFDPTDGTQLREVWNGTRTQILAISGAFKSAGAKVRTYNKGALWALDALWSVGTISGGGGGVGAEVPIDQWGFEVEWVQVDLRSNPKLIAAAGGSDTLALWVKDIEAAIKAGQSLSAYFVEQGSTPTVADEEQALYDLKARGQEAYEIKRVTLRRRRTYSTTYATPIVLNAVEVVYTTSALISALSIPTTVQAQLPANPPETPSGTVWAWKERRQDQDTILARNKIEETSDWVFAAWPLLTYNVIS